jgi:GNAT superfamily N-acetyltransferase
MGAMLSAMFPARQASVLQIHELGPETPKAVLRDLDTILAAARNELVGRDAVLETAADRTFDGPERIVLWAAYSNQPVGLVDAVLHHPSPLDLTYAQLAVASSHRYRGIARQLVAEAERRAARLIEGSSPRYAAVLPSAYGAHAFWTSLGFEPSHQWPELLCSPEPQISP